MSSVSSQASDIDVDLGKLFSSLLRSWRLIVLVTVAVTVAAFFLASSATPLYRAEARILIETSESPFTRPTTTQTEAITPMLDEQGITSQVQVISSSDILRRVATDLDLASRSEFDPAANPSFVRRMLISLGLGNDGSDTSADQRVLSAMVDRLKVYNVERSRVIVIEFSSQDPQLAADVPNRIAEAYLEVQRGARILSNDAATGWLQPEIDRLSESVKTAEAKVATYRAQSDLLVGQNNSVLATQQLSELTSELSRVRANRSAAEANAESLRAAIDAGASLETAPQVLSSPLIQRLRERRVELNAQIADLSTTLLGNHPRLRALNSQLGDLDTQIRSEARKVLIGLETEARNAAAREQSLTADLDRLKTVSANADAEGVELRALEREAAAQRALLESYLSRYREAVSRGEGGYLPADARIFQRAVPPIEPYFPKVVPITIAVFVGTLLILSIVTLLRELFSGRAMRPARKGFYEVDDLAMPTTAEERANLAAEEALAETTDAKATAAHLVAADRRRAIFISPEGDEAAAASVMVARELADRGKRVLLLDMTSSGAASHPMLDGAVKPGITDLLAAQAQFTDVIHPDAFSDCHVIPAGNADADLAMRGADRLPIILRSLTSAYDVVVVECGVCQAESIGRLVSDDAEVLLSVISPRDAAVQSAEADLEAAGYPQPLLVSPAGRPAGTGDYRSAA